MKITDDSQITYGEMSQDGRTFWQDLIFNGETIGALAQTETSILNPVKERYQICVIESEIDYFDGWYESEDEGYVFGYFHTLEKFIEYYNNRILTQ